MIVVRFSVLLNVVQFIKNISNEHLIKPIDLTIACDGHMLVCDCGDNTVKVLSPDGTELPKSFYLSLSVTVVRFSVLFSGLV